MQPYFAFVISFWAIQLKRSRWVNVRLDNSNFHVFGVCILCETFPKWWEWVKPWPLDDKSRINQSWESRDLNEPTEPWTTEKIPFRNFIYIIAGGLSSITSAISENVLPPPHRKSCCSALLILPKASTKCKYLWLTSCTSLALFNIILPQNTGFL